MNSPLGTHLKHNYNCQCLGRESGWPGGTLARLALLRCRELCLEGPDGPLRQRLDAAGLGARVDPVALLQADGPGGAPEPEGGGEPLHTQMHAYVDTHIFKCTHTHIHTRTHAPTHKIHAHATRNVQHATRTQAHTQTHTQWAVSGKQPVWSSCGRLEWQRRGEGRKRAAACRDK